MRLNGFVFMHRSIIDWEWYKDIPVRLLFEHLIYIANFKDSNWKGIEVKRGQVITGRKTLAEDTGLSERQVRTALKKLQSTGEIAIKATNKYSLITIVNYGLYQSELLTMTSQMTNNRPTNDQQMTNNRPQLNNDNKVIMEEGKKVSLNQTDHHSPSEPNMLPKSADDVKRYCISMGYTKVNPVTFYNYYNERHWITGNRPITNWHALVKKWNETEREQIISEENPEEDPEYTKWYNDFIEHEYGNDWRDKARR